ncbi:MAG: carboxymuconolactone decarboxylase family protein [Bacteroidetes bacterium]|nr:carboxymuconolactone decarboxylase family protein [Bacteroidota bacterium]
MKMRIDWYKVSPSAYNAMLNLQRTVNKSKLDKYLLELIKIRASQLNGCAHCLDMHTKDALAIGESEQRINLLTVWREAPIYTPREKAAIAWCESLTLISQIGAPDNLYEEVVSFFNPEELVELTLAIVAINAWNRLGVGFKSDVGNYVSNRNSK